VFPINGDDGILAGDIVHFAIYDERRYEARAWLERQGWTAAYAPEEPRHDRPPVLEPGLVARN